MYNLFQAPSWGGALISSVYNERINAEKIAAEQDIAEKNRRTNAEIAAANRASNEAIAAANRETNRAIAEMEMMGRAEVSAGEIQGRIDVANIQAASAKEVAEIQAKANIGGSVIRTVPTVFPFVFSGKGGGDSGNTTLNTPNKPNGDVKDYIPYPQRKQEKARKDADNLFPELEPTFGTSTSLTTISEGLSPAVKQSIVNAGGVAILGGLVTQLLPFLI